MPDINVQEATVTCENVRHHTIAIGYEGAMTDRPDIGTLRATIDRCLAERDRPGAVRAALDAVSSDSIDIETLYTAVLGPLLTHTGNAWQNGLTAVWEEHFASATVRTIIESLSLDVAERSDRVPRNGRTIVLACPPGEYHDLGLRMLSDRLSLAGWHAIYLGADTPVPDIANAARAVGAQTVALSAATHYNRMLLRDVIDDLSDRLPGVRVGVGGPAFTHDDTLASDHVLTETDLGLGAQVDMRT